MVGETGELVNESQRSSSRFSNSEFNSATHQFNSQLPILQPYACTLISTFDLGRQPFGLASPAAWLRREGIDVRSLDLAKEKLDPEALRSADLVAFHLPMHTATRLAAPVIKNARAMNPSARICAYGLYAPLNDAFLRSLGVDDVLGGEFEAD